jgi:hypothetical protein
MLSRLLSVVLLGCVLLLAGCVAHSDWMAPVAARSPLRAPPNAALVVFVRPSAYAGGMLVPIIDENGRFLGEAGPKTHFAVVTPPGDHVFIGWMENTSAVRTRLVAGKTYYVEIGPRWGLLKPRVHLLAVTPRSKSWEKLAEWLADTEEMTPDLAGGQAALDRKHGDVQSHIHDAFEALRDFDDVELDAHTVKPDDGV